MMRREARGASGRVLLVGLSNEYQNKQMRMSIEIVIILENFPSLMLCFEMSKKPNLSKRELIIKTFPFELCMHMCAITSMNQIYKCHAVLQTIHKSV